MKFKFINTYTWKKESHLAPKIYLPISQRNKFYLEQIREYMRNKMEKFKLK